MTAFPAIDPKAKPPICTQLDNGFATAEEDCGVMGTQRSILFASYNLVDVDVQELRRWMGEPTGATGPDDWKRAIEHPQVAARFAKVGLMPAKARMLSGVAVKIAEDDLAADKMLTAAVWYGTLNLLKPGKSCSRTFNDNHCVSFLGALRPAGTKRVTTEYDSLADGRTRVVAGERITYPKGPQTFPWNVAKAMFGDVRVRQRDAQGRIVKERQLGDGLVWGITVARAKQLPAPPPPDTTPEPVRIETDAQKIARLESTVVDLRGQVATRDAVAVVLVGQRDGAKAGLASAKAAIGELRLQLDDVESDVDDAITASGGPLT